MATTVEELRTELGRLSDTERGELAHFLILSLDQSSDANVEMAWDAELDRRAEEIRNGRASGEPANKVFSELRAKYS